MKNTRSYSASRRLFISIAAALVLVTLAGISAAVAQRLVQPDGRLNQIAHFGGDALYCVDANNNPTNDLPTFQEGGFRLLSANGQERWFVSAADVAAAIATLEAGAEPVLVASGQGSYGAVNLYAYLVGTEPELVFTGYDEHGKPNSLTLRGCSPVGPEPAVGETVSTPEAELCEVQYDVQVTLFQVSGNTVPCDQCEAMGGDLSGDVCWLTLN